MNWRPIETAFRDLPFKVLGGGRPFKDYAPALVYGPTWEPNAIGGDWPEDGKGAWAGEPRVAIASTYQGQGFWTIQSDAPSEYEVYVQPSHWMPLPEAPHIIGHIP